MKSHLHQLESMKIAHEEELVLTKRHMRFQQVNTFLLPVPFEIVNQRNYNQVSIHRSGANVHRPELVII